MSRLYGIDYCMYSTMGRVRRNNEDNYYVGGLYRKDVSLKDDEMVTGRLVSNNNDMAAVFDGMGGEACGEIASLVAARTCCDFSADKKKYEEYLYELSGFINNEILRETDNRSLVLMGTTGCMIQFGDDTIYVLNVGDSRMYKLSGSEFKQISVDHIAPGYGSKAPLTKFFGYPTEKKSLSPYIAMGSYKTGDIYVLCSDGVTDMVGDEEMRDILKKDQSVECSAKEIISLAMQHGGVDNATIIVLKITD